MVVLFLVGLVSMILMRTLRKDYARYSRKDDIDEMVCIHLRTYTVCIGIVRMLPSTCLTVAMVTCVCRRGTWEMSMDGSRYMVMCSDHRPTRCSSPLSLAAATR
jgi:hypothetical protein